MAGNGGKQDEFYLRYYVGHEGRIGHKFLEFKFRPDGKLRYANSNYKNTMIRKKASTTFASSVGLGLSPLVLGFSLASGFASSAVGLRPALPRHSASLGSYGLGPHPLLTIARLRFGLCLNFPSPASNRPRLPSPVDFPLGTVSVSLSRVGLGFSASASAFYFGLGPTASASAF